MIEQLNCKESINTKRYNMDSLYEYQYVKRKKRSLFTRCDEQRL